MSDPKKPEKAPDKPHEKTYEKPREPIAVKRLWFGANKVDVPGMSFVGAVTSEGKYKLEYLPWLQHHRITWGDRPPIMVHASNVASWEPL